MHTVALSLFVAASAGAVDIASLDEPADIAGTWRLHLGDGDGDADADGRTAFAAAAFDDSAWEAFPVPGALGEHGHLEFSGIYWLRVTLRLPPHADARDQLSLRISPIDSAGEVFIDGALIQELGHVDTDDNNVVDAHDLLAIVPIPASATQDGVVVVAIRAVRTRERADASPPRGGIVGGPNWIGKTADVVRAQDLRNVDKLLSGFTVIVIALYHFLLFRRRRAEIHYFWFGAFSFFMGSYLLLSMEASIAFWGPSLNARLFWPAVMSTFPTFVQFLWPLLGRPIRWWWRINQAGFVLFSIAAASSANSVLANKLIGWVELLLLLPLIIAVVGLIVQAAWRGNPEARTLLVGTLALVVGAINNIVLERTTLPLPLIMSYAMAVFVFSIAVSLANRFARLYRELDDKHRLKEEVRVLNAHLQTKVHERSEELSKALSKLAAKPGAAGGAADDVAKGTTIDGRFVIERLLGKGGMGAVYAGHDANTGRAVAIKVIKASSTGELDVLHRFLREARAAVAVDHPAVVRMLHVDVSSDGLFYQAQELVDGVTLEEKLKAGVVDVPIVARTGAILADALAAAHARGVIHRDVKPSNVMLTAAAPGVKLLDFGVAKITGSAASASDETGTGRHIGTPGYMAPELRFVVDDAAVTDKVDVYALGVVLHRMALGALPGRALDARTDAKLLALIDRCLAKDPADRPTARALADDLARLADEHGAPATPAWESAATTETAKPSGVTDLLRELVRTP